MKRIFTSLLRFAKNEWLLLIAIVALLYSSVYIGSFPIFTYGDFEILYILLVLFIIVKGIENSGLFLKIAGILDNIKNIPVLLILLTFFLSMIVTNDVALIIMVPLTMNLVLRKKELIVILEAIAANAGSSLTPIGNPQNLYIYWYYNLHPCEFFRVIIPFSLSFLILLSIVGYIIKSKPVVKPYYKKTEIRINKVIYIYGPFLLIFILAVFRIIPIYVGVIIVIYSILFDRKSLKIDYMLLLTFLCFFGVSNNLKIMFFDDLRLHSGHIFFLSAFASQIMSNVPAALVISKFTTDWKSLLWGVSVGGFGSIVGSLANLIAYRLYNSAKSESDDRLLYFTLKFFGIGFVAFFIGMAIFILFKRYM